MSDAKNKPARDIAASPVWALIVAGIATLFFYQAIRDILISRNMEQMLLILVIGLIGGPALAVLLTWIWRPSISIVIGTIATAPG